MLTLCDLDGVVGDPCDLIRTYLLGPKKDWDTYFKHTLEVKPIPEMIAMIDSLMLWDQQPVMFGTGRPESNRELTEKWMNMYFKCYIDSDIVLMRSSKDCRPSMMIKLEWACRLHPTLIIEDEPGAVALFRKYNFTVLQVHGYRLEDADQIPS